MNKQRQFQPDGAELVRFMSDTTARVKIYFDGSDTPGTWARR